MNDVNGRPVHIGDTVLIVGEKYEGQECRVVAFDDEFVRVSSAGQYHDYVPSNFGKYPRNIKLLLDPDLDVDEGL